VRVPVTQGGLSRPLNADPRVVASGAMRRLHPVAAQLLNYPRWVSSAKVDLRGLGFSYGARPVLRNVDAAIGDRSRVAVVGPNGVGKSSLLRLVAGLEEPESGTVAVRPLGATVGFLPQERDRRPDEALGQYLARRTGVAAAEAAMQRAAAALAAANPSADAAYATALDHYLAIGAPDFESRAEAVLAGLGLRPDKLSQATATLSGGELARAGLAAILLTRGDLLLLDEPTNDLDAVGLTRLEEFLVERDGTLLVVSHDRAFLERTADQVLELDEFSHAARLFGGGFSAYVVERDRAKATAREAFEAYAQTRQALVARAVQEKDWAPARGESGHVVEGAPRGKGQEHPSRHRGGCTGSRLRSRQDPARA
jgi:ATPase subunit of ABC transporter with duplicated ATPase domains